MGGGGGRGGGDVGTAGGSGHGQEPRRRRAASAVAHQPGATKPRRRSQRVDKVGGDGGDKVVFRLGLL